MDRAFTLCVFKAIGTSLTARWFLKELSTSLYLAVFSHQGLCMGFLGGGGRAGCVSAAVCVLAKLQEL